MDNHLVYRPLSGGGVGGDSSSPQENILDLSNGLIKRLHDTAHNIANTAKKHALGADDALLVSDIFLMAYSADVAASVLALIAVTRRSVITEANHSNRLLGDLMINLTEEADKFKGFKKMV